MVVHARENEEPKNAVLGMVDMERVFDASDAPLQMAQQSALSEAEAQKRWESMRTVPQLTVMELGEYANLVAKAQPTPDQQNRMKELKTLSDRRTDEFQALQMKANLTGEEQTRLKALLGQSRLVQ